MTATKFGESRIKSRRQSPITAANLRFFLRSSTGPNGRFQPQSLGRVRDPVRIAEGPTAIDAARHRRHLGFPENVAMVVTFPAFNQDSPASSILVAVTFSTPLQR